MVSETEYTLLLVIATSVIDSAGLIPGKFLKFLGVILLR
jgi:hypothetical protein